MRYLLCWRRFNHSDLIATTTPLPHCLLLSRAPPLIATLSPTVMSYYFIIVGTKDNPVYEAELGTSTSRPDVVVNKVGVGHGNTMTVWRYIPRVTRCHRHSCTEGRPTPSQPVCGAFLAWCYWGNDVEHECAVSHWSAPVPSIWRGVHTKLEHCICRRMPDISRRWIATTTRQYRPMWLPAVSRWNGGKANR